MKLDIQKLIDNSEIKLSPKLIRDQGLSPQEVLDVINLHKDKKELLQQFVGVEDKDKLEELRLELEDLEFLMQHVWHFKENKDFHMHWLSIPQCTCSNYKNRFGKKLNYNPECSIHKHLVKEIR